MVDMEQLKLKIYQKWNCKESADDAIKYTQIQFNYFSDTIFIGISFQYIRFSANWFNLVYIIT